MRAWVTEYLDVNELGLAFEYLVEHAIESGIALSPAARSELRLAAAEMSLEDNSAWLAIDARPPVFDNPSQ